MLDECLIFVDKLLNQLRENTIETLDFSKIKAITDLLDYCNCESVRVLFHLHSYPSSPNECNLVDSAHYNGKLLLSMGTSS